MPGEPSNTQKDRKHLARVRENQRRCRARRKEYLQQLEERFRQCEAQGVQASVEMQAAARRVLEENERLKAMLRERGVNDAEIDFYAGGTSILDRLTGPFESVAASGETASRTLQDLIRKQTLCCADAASGQCQQVDGDDYHGSSVSSGISSPASTLAQLSTAKTPANEHAESRRSFQQYQGLHPQPDRISTTTMSSALSCPPPRSPNPSLIASHYDNYYSCTNFLATTQPHTLNPPHPQHHHQSHSSLECLRKFHRQRPDSHLPSRPAATGINTSRTASPWFEQPTTTQTLTQSTANAPLETQMPFASACFTEDVNALDLLSPELHSQFPRCLQGMRYEIQDNESSTNVPGQSYRCMDGGSANWTGSGRATGGGYPSF